MKHATLTAAATLFAAIATAAPAPVANQLWVTNKINEVVGTNTAAKIAAASNATLTAANAYTDAAIIGAGVVTPQMATNAAAAVVVRDVPSWARSATPPESMTDNAVVLTNSALKTKGGESITATNVGALSAHGGTATRASGQTAGVSYTLQGGGYDSENYQSGNGAELTLGGGDGDDQTMDGGNGAELTIGGGGYGNGQGGNGATVTFGGGGTGSSGGNGAKVTLEGGGSAMYAGWEGAGAELKIGGRGKNDETELPAAGYLIISHTGTSNETLQARIERDAQTVITNAGYMTKTAADAAYYPKSSGEAWSAYWDGDDVRVTVTNYDSTANISSLYLEQKTNEVALATNLFKTVWREMAHWEKFLGTNWNWNATWDGFQTWKTDVAGELEEKADRAWGYYNSHTGTYSPDGYTQISSSNVMIAAGMSYQKTLTTSAEVWVLTANEPYESTGISTNGGFQIRDGDGNVQFEIIKGDKTTVAAQAHTVTVDQATSPQTLVVCYNIIAATHPTAEICLDLSTANWKAETAADCPATVTWSGSSGAYVARIQPKTTTTKCFCKATYQRGGDTYINNRCAVGMSQIVLGGVTYDLGTNTISGKLVLTLTPAN